MLKKLTMLLIAVCAIVVLAGCQSTTKTFTDATGNKNVNVGGYLTLGELETANPETITPQGRMIVGKVEYRSRKVGIPAEQKVPTTGFFRAIKSTTLFGTEEQVIEYDFTTGSDADAKAALEALEKKREAAEKAFADNKAGNTEAPAK